MRKSLTAWPAHAPVAAGDEGVRLGLIKAHDASLDVRVRHRICRRPLLGDPVDCHGLCKRGTRTLTKRGALAHGQNAHAVDRGKRTSNCSACSSTWRVERSSWYVWMCIFARVAFGGAVQGLPWWHGFCSSMQLFACMQYFTTWLLELGARRVTWNSPPTELWEDVVSD